MSGIIALITSLILVVAFVISPKLRKHKFINILKYLAISGCMCSLGLSFGFPSNGSALCQVQAFLIIFFLAAVGAWVSWIFYHFYYQSFYSEQYVEMIYIHISSWLFASFVAFFPFSGQLHYGRQEDLFIFADDSGVCLFASSSQTNFRNFALIPAVILLSLVLIFNSWVGISVVKKYGFSVGPIRAIFTISLIAAVAWIPCIITVILVAADALTPNETNRDLFSLLFALGFQAGSIISILFIKNNEEIKNVWKLVLFKWSLSRDDDSLNESLGPSDFPTSIVSAYTIGMMKSQSPNESLGPSDY